MILQINNMLNFTHGSINATKNYISSALYPEQDNDFINKYVRIRFYDKNNNIRMLRLNINKNIFKEFTGNNSYDDWKFKIVRFDKTEPNIAILVDRANRVVVTTTEMIRNLYYHPGYKIGEDEVNLPIIDWDSFNAKYVNEFIHTYPVQNKQYLGRLVFTEYIKDIKEKSITSNVLIPEDQYKEFSDIKEQLLIGNPDLSVLPDCILKSFPYYYDRHKMDRLDIPRRAINPGVIIRADENDSDPYIVVMEYMNDNTVRFVTDRECYIYYETETRHVNIGELNICQK